MKHLQLAAMLLGLGLAVVGCNGGDKGATTAGNSSNGATEGNKLTIAVIPKGSTHEFWKSVHEGADKAAHELGVDMTFKGPVKEDDRESQIKTVEDFITKKVDGIVLAPLDKAALKGPVNEAKQAGIPVVIIDSPLDGYDNLVATDNEKGGHMAGAEMARLLGGKGSIVLLRYEEGSASTMLREKGFLDEIAKTPAIKVVSSNQYGGATADSAQKAGENMLASHKKSDGSLDIDGIYTPNESTTFGMLRVLQDNSWAGKVKFVGFDSAPKLLDGLHAGQINALVVQNPRNMGYLGVKTLVDDIKAKKEPNEKIDTGATLVTKENVDSPANKELLAAPKN